MQSLVKDYLSFLKSTGFKGFRFDMVKGYSASYIGSYVSASAPVFSVGRWLACLNLRTTISTPIPIPITQASTGTVTRTR
ncbi:hypothetical protein EON63_05650 [archaeon]|nr:MAG: hypothetical protein EON63_05650 [archaeon]